MKKTKITMLLFLFMIAAKLNSQTCASPIDLPDWDNQWQYIDSFSTSTRWLKFKADASPLIIEAYVKNYNSSVHGLTIYENDCTNLPVVTTTTSVSGNIITKKTAALTIGNYYLIKLTNNSGGYMIYQLRKRYVASVAVLGCTNVTCFATPNCEYVCNGSFECLTTTPSNLSQIQSGAVSNWTTANNGSADIFATSSTFASGVQVPCNIAGYSSTYTGNNYGGFIPTYSTSVLEAEYLQTQLLSPLTAGKTYSVSFWVKKGRHFTHKIEELGIFLTSSQINNNNYLPITNFTFAASTTNTVLLNDYTNWQNIVFYYTAFGGEQFLTIGSTSNAMGTPTVLTAPTTPTCSYASTISDKYIYIDEVSLREVITTPSMTFNLPSSICLNETITLSGLATPSGGVFSGNGVTYSAPNYYFNGALAGLGVHTLTYVLNTCSLSGTITATISVVNSNTITATSNTANICTNFGQTATLTAAATISSSVNYTWQPGNLSGSSVTVAPSSTTIYTLTGNNLGCVGSNTISVLVYSFCCSSTVSAYLPTTINNSNLTTPFVFNSDVTITAGNCDLHGAEFLFAPNVKLIVAPGASLHLISAHLYGCSGDMWQGIVMQSNSHMDAYSETNDNLIEDAKTAIDITGHSTSSLTGAAAILNIQQTTFNKNFIGISISNYTLNVNPYPFNISNCVFTSRSLTFSPTSWPSISTTSPGLRAAASSTTGLAVPYQLNGVSISNLKNPYSSYKAHKGIELISVGTATYPTTYRYIQIGNQDLVSNFNIFDALGQAIEADNSNVYSLNNVFQNTQRYVFDPIVAQPYMYGGNAIRHTSQGNFNSALNLTPSGATSPTLSYIGSRFYNCHNAINCDNVYNFNCRFATFRSTQTNTNTAFGPGNTGISLRSNRMFYIIDDNNFANINTAINVPINVGSYSTNVSTYFGVNANCLQMNRNYIGAQITAATTPTNEYVNKAITLSFPLTTSLTNVTTPNFVIQSNTISNVYRGIEIYMISKSNFPVQMKTNTISLQDDNTFSLNQWGIKMLQNGGGTIRSNTLVGESTTNTQVALFHSDLSDKDSVFCNELSDAYQGFLFEHLNAMNHWKGNKMDNMERGLTLMTGAITGTQGGVGSAIDDEWQNSWTSTNYGTYVGGSSIASVSPIYVKTSGGYFPPNPGWDGSITWAQSYSNTVATPTASGSFSCDDETPVANPSNLFFNIGSGFGNANHAYIANAKMYRYYLMMDVYERMMYDEYFGTYGTANMSYAFEAEKYLQDGDLENADKYNGLISIDNDIEYYIVTFNNIYINYLQNEYTQEDSTTLYYMANSCPGEYGSTVYQARALFNYIYSRAFNYIEDCGTGEGRPNPLKEQASAAVKNKVGLKINMFPNPTSNSLTFVGQGNSSEDLEIKISDINGKYLLGKKVKINEKIEIDLKNGMYFVLISNSKNEKTIKKLIISK